jgi:hypothetical protein
LCRGDASGQACHQCAQDQQCAHDPSLSCHGRLLLVKIATERYAL